MANVKTEKTRLCEENVVENSDFEMETLDLKTELQEGTRLDSDILEENSQIRVSKENVKIVKHAISTSCEENVSGCSILNVKIENDGISLTGCEDNVDESSTFETETLVKTDLQDGGSDELKKIQVSGVKTEYVPYSQPDTDKFDVVNLNLSKKIECQDMKFFTDDWGQGSKQRLTHCVEDDKYVKNSFLVTSSTGLELGNRCNDLSQCPNHELKYSGVNIDEKTQQVECQGSNKNNKFSSDNSGVKCDSYYINSQGFSIVGGGRSQEKCDVNNINSQGLLDQKILKDVPSKLKPHVCDKCGKCFPFPSKLLIHYRSHTKDKPFACEVCQKLFRRQDALRYHLMTHKGKQSFECDICHKTFSRNPDLMRHLITHSSEKPFECEQCQRVYNRKDHLQEHMKTHSSEQTFKCNICQKAFFLPNILKRHLATHKQEKSFKCLTCQKSYARKDYLDKHVRKFHCDKNVPGDYH